MKRWKKYLVTIALVLMAFVIMPMNVDAAPKVKLNKTKLTLYVGQNTTLKVSGTKNIKWSTSNKKVATVTNKGKVTAKKKGSATITAKTDKKKLTCKVTVKNPTLNKTKVTLDKGKTTTLKLTGSTVKSWSSTNKKVATVSKKGKVTAKGAGTTTIKAKAKNGKTYSCKVTVKEVHTHKYVSSVSKSATCTEDGVITHLCSCGATYYDTIPKTGHNFDNGVITTKETCTKEGLKTFTCLNCKTTKTEKIAPYGHTLSDWIVVKSATCTELGSKKKECTTCHTTLETASIEVAPHTPSDWITDKQATCTENGSKHKECTVCYTTLETETIETIDHIPSDWITDKNATCTENGSKHKECTVCYATLETETITDGHSYDNGVVTKNPTCTETGVKTFSCSKCDATKTEPIEMIDHTSSEWITDKEVTCAENGSKHKECTACHTTLETEEIVTTGHSYVDTVVTPTCTEPGYTSYECSYCGDSGIYEDSYTNATEHNYEYVTTKDATCTEAGYTEYKCSKCDDVKQDTIRAKGHTYGKFVETLVPADFETFGTANMVCPTCEETLFSDLTAVKVDLGNGNSETVYGYYDYDEAKTCFDLTYNYLANHENSTIAGWVEKYGFVWNENKYNYSCIRVAEMAWQYNTIGTVNHKRPNGSNLGCGENLAYKAKFESGTHSILVEYSDEEVFQDWLDSQGHKDNIEGGYEQMAVSKFTAWVPEWEGWMIFWVQDFY